MSAILSPLEDEREVWMPVRGYEGIYEVSNLGRVQRAGKDLVPSETNGYLHLSLCKFGRIKTHRVHTLVLTAFCGAPPFPEAQGAHNDGNQSNNRLTNLRWATPKENQADAERHGTRCKGEKVFGAVLMESEVRQIRERIARGERNRPIAEHFEVSISTIHLIRHGRIWKHVQ